MLGMTRSRVAFIWIHFHVQSNTATYQEDGSDVDGDTEEDEEGEEYLVELSLERVQKEEEEKTEMICQYIVMEVMRKMMTLIAM
eukprot:327261-Ditylum_brightwellii.AAC.1